VLRRWLIATTVLLLGCMVGGFWSSVLTYPHRNKRQCVVSASEMAYWIRLAVSLVGAVVLLLFLVQVLRA